MNCQQFDQIVIDLARDGGLEAGTPQAAADHVQSCPQCAVRLSDQGKLAVALRAVNAAASDEQAPASVERSLRRAFRARFDGSRPANAVQAASPQGGSPTWRVWAVAAAAMLLLGLVATWKRQPTAPVQPVKQASSPQPVANKKAEKLTAVGNGETQTTSALARHSASRPRRTAEYGASSKPVATPDETATTELTTRFYPLPYGSGLGLDEGWGLVRVQVPRASLASVGVPVSGGSGDEMLTADVVVGQDGLARGIRFVQ
jgi:hypothetical protein